MEEPKRKLTISYKKSPDYKLFPATGAWGGRTPDNQVIMNVFIDHAALPNYQTFEVDQEGHVDLKTPLESISAGDGERVVLCGIVMTPQTAKNLAEWLNRNADSIISGQG